MRFHRAFIIVAALLAASACARIITPAAAPAPAVAYTKAPYDTVWQRTVRFFALQQVPISIIETASGLIESRQFALPRTDLDAWVDCGKMGSGESALAVLEQHNNTPTAMADFTVLLERAGDSTAVHVTMGVAATAIAPAGRVPVTCTSNGHFEQALMASLTQTPAAG